MRAYLALGSNLGDRVANLRRAVADLDGVVGVSPVYETHPLGGPGGQGAYLNAVVALETGCTPRDLLDECRRLEADAGRVRAERWGARTLDVDVLLVGDLRVDEPDLVVPHPRLWERRFVLAPLRDLDPDLVTAAAVAAARGEVSRTTIDLVPVGRPPAPGGPSAPTEGGGP